jgi:hypothetical protein
VAAAVAARRPAVAFATGFAAGLLFAFAGFLEAIGQFLLRKSSIAIATCTASGAPQATATHIHQG